MPPRVLIFGTGAVGIGYACLLSRKVPPEHLVTVCRSNYDTARVEGFRMASTVLKGEMTCKPTVVRSVEEAIALKPTIPFDYVIVTTKVLPVVPSTAELIKPAIGNKTAIALFQNGIAIEGEFARLYPHNPILSTVVYFATTQTSPGVIRHSEIELLHIGTFPADAPLEHKDTAGEFVRLINDCGATAKLHDDVQLQRWIKLILNATLNPVCALARSRDAEVLGASQDALQVVRDTMSEIAAVAQAHGCHSINEDVVNTQMRRIQNRRQAPGVEPSMMADALAHRHMEVDAIVGNVVRMASEKNVAVPILRTLYVLISALNASFDRSHK